jgi:SSS family solute:Na+ symporter/sodium/proline symporter
MIVKWIVIAAYAAMIFTVGLFGLRRTRTFSDFLLGGGRIGPWMTAFTYAAAYFSAVLFIGFAGKIGWGFGYSGLWIAAGNALFGVLAVWWIFGNRIRVLAAEYGAHTMPEFLERRYRSPFLKLYGALAIFVFFVPYSSAVFMGLSYLFQSNFGLPYGLALVLMGGFTTLYLVMGGYKSMAMIDVIFGMIMVAGVSILLGFTLQRGGGLANLTDRLSAIDPALTRVVGPPGAWPLFCLVFLTSVAPLGMPQLVHKFYAIKDRRSIRIGMIMSTLLAVLICGTAYFVGSATRLFLSPESTPAAFEGGRPVFDRLMPELLSNVIPGSLSVLILLLVLSASMSTLAALVLISSAAVVKDFYAGFVEREASDRRLTLLIRILSAVFVAISVVLAAGRFETIVAILGISWGAIGSVFLGPFVWGALTRRAATRAGAVASSILGLVTCLGLYAAGRPSPEAGTIGMIVSLAANPVVSRLVPDPRCDDSARPRG